MMLAVDNTMKFSSLPEVGKVHGTAFEISFGETSFILFPIYHPASIIYNRSLDEVYKKDLKKFFLEISKKFEKKC